MSRLVLRRCRHNWRTGAITRGEYLHQMIDALRHAGRLGVLSRYHRGLLDGLATRWDAHHHEAGGKRVERWHFREFDVGRSGAGPNTPRVRGRPAPVCPGGTASRNDE